MPSRSSQSLKNTSQKQSEAARKNGSLSKGPITYQGKEASRKAVLKAGIFTSAVTLDGSTGEQEIVEIREDLLQRYKPLPS
jgi:hypothetical protein